MSLLMTGYSTTAAQATPVITGNAEPKAPSPQAEAFYTEVLRELKRSGQPVLLAGTFAVCAYTGITRPTKDLDVFCRAGDFPRILGHFQNLGFAVEVEDERWIAKVRRGEQFFDIIFASANGTMPVGDAWFEHARQVEVLGTQVGIVSPTELIWSRRSFSCATATTAPTSSTSSSSSTRTSSGSGCSPTWSCIGKCC
jgi:hypothetical protein